MTLCHREVQYSLGVWWIYPTSCHCLDHPGKEEADRVHEPERISVHVLMGRLSPQEFITIHIAHFALHLHFALHTENCTPYHGSLNVPIFHITQPLGIWSINVYNGYYKVMSNIPKMGHLPTPAYAPLSTLCTLHSTLNSTLYTLRSTLYTALRSIVLNDHSNTARKHTCSYDSYRCFLWARSQTIANLAIIYN